MHILNQIAGYHRYHCQIRSDYGSEYLAYRLQQGVQEHCVYRYFIQPVKPAQNAFIKRLNRTFREDVLDSYVFSNLREFQEMAFDWMEMYNTTRPYESLGNLSPQQYAIRAVFQLGSLLMIGTKYGLLTFLYNKTSKHQEITKQLIREFFNYLRH